MLLQYLPLLVLVFFPHGSLSAVDPNCDYYQEIALGQEYYIYNVEYPRNYTSSRSCRWTGQSPPGTVIVLSCTDVDIPYSRNCQGDRLLFSPTGDQNFQSADVESYCGQTSFTAYTYTNAFALGLIPAANTRGGRFLCSLAAMHVAQSCTCGFKSQKKIVGGQNTGINEYPFMAVLLNIVTHEAYCGANIISNRYALTAAHCLLNQLASTVGLLVGDWDIETGNDTAAAALYQIETIRMHTLYDQIRQHNDIGVVKTRISIQFSMAVSPVCLPFIYREYNFLGESATALGWGYTDIGGNKPDILQKVDLSVVSNAQCDAALTESIDSTQICTYARGKDACLSDSGGPIVWQDGYSGKLELVGIISFGQGCATDKPAVNTRVTAFLAWIASVTPDASYCIQ